MEHPQHIVPLFGGVDQQWLTPSGPSPPPTPLSTLLFLSFYICCGLIEKWTRMWGGRGRREGGKEGERKRKILQIQMQNKFHTHTTRANHNWIQLPHGVRFGGVSSSLHVKPSIIRFIDRLIHQASITSDTESL